MIVRLYSDEYQCSVDTKLNSVVDIRGIKTKAPYISVCKECGNCIKLALEYDGMVTIEGNYVNCYTMNNEPLGSYPVENEFVNNVIVQIGSLKTTDFGIVIGTLCISDVIEDVISCVDGKVLTLS